MNGGYGDNYYMQLHYINKFKYGNVKNEPASSISIDVKVILTSGIMKTSLHTLITLMMFSIETKHQLITGV